MGNGNSRVSPALLEEKHVVIIGGGYGGIALASTLQKNQIPFTLIDPKDCFHHNVAACRAGVFPGRLKIVQEYYTYFVLSYILDIFRPFRISKYFWLRFFSLPLGKKCHHIVQFFLQ